MSLKDEDTAPGRRLKITFDGVTVELPGPDGVTLTDLYESWRAHGLGESFEVHDCDGRLVATGKRIPRVRRRPAVDVDD